MDEEIEYFLLAMLYFSLFLMAGVLLGPKYGVVINLPVLGGLCATTYMFYITCLRGK